MAKKLARIRTQDDSILLYRNLKRLHKHTPPRVSRAMDYVLYLRKQVTAALALFGNAWTNY